MYTQNARYLEQFPTYRPLVAFPFGLPRCGYTRESLTVVNDLGAQAVFSAFPQINRWGRNQVLHRIVMTARHDTKARVLQRLQLNSARARAQSCLGMVGVARYRDQLVA